ncbi:hypothetical protein [Homoserinibacter sp. GY 40078]|uniref:hypothetical protein n=1 Tax=Homoserinibacter sp. GY 40078 TaxID=2603275 RepID=UPI0011CBA99B|nr:hypothetical protein [Homoserinibacter sp. GY 40078]TXK17310.1 hypothetical protein FVQ89_10720 [Homoserinibacter sp. GY 40078]
MDHHTDPTERLRAAAGAPAAPALDSALIAEAPDRPAPRLVRHGRLARGAGIGVTALAAVTVGALVITNPFAAPKPLFAAAAAGGDGGAEASASADASRIAMWVDYDYVAGDGLSSNGGRGTVYELRRSGDPAVVAERIASQFALDGSAELSQYSTPDYPSYVVGPEDGSGASLTLSWAGSGDWWYNDPAASPAPVCIDVPVDSEDEEAGSYQECTTPEVAESAAPGEAEARELAARLFSATGLAVEASDVMVTADETQTYASATLTIDGTSTALEWTVAWSPLGSIWWASGHAVEAVAKGEYDTVSPVDAVGRLEDGRWFGAASPEYGGGVMYAADSLVRGAGTEDSGDSDALTTPAPAEPDEQPTVLPEPEPGLEPEPEPGVEEPLPTPESVVVTLDHAESTLLLLWDVDGNAWLVPGHAFEDPDQGFWTSVVSLVEGVIALPDPAQVEPMPAEVQ